MLIGDLLGNVYFIEVDQSNKGSETSTQFTLLKCFPFMHSKTVRDIQWFPNNEEGELFSSSSDDGYLVIGNLDQVFMPAYKYASHRVITVILVHILLESSVQLVVISGTLEESSWLRTQTFR